MTRSLPFIIVAAVALITISGATVLYRNKQHPALTLTGGHNEADDRFLHVRGDEDAPVTIEEFGDFECPPCATLAGPLDKLEEDYRPNVRLVFRNFPLPMHAHAREAALASEAAALQGRFWDMHDLLYREQLAWTKSPQTDILFNVYAGLLGLDVDQFKKDMAGDEVKARVDADVKKGSALGITNTPTIFLNDRAIDPRNLRPDLLRGTVDAAVKAQTK